MKRNIVSISDLEDKGYKVLFSDGKVLAWHKNSSMDTTKVIGMREERLYRLNSIPVQALVHESTSMGELSQNTSSYKLQSSPSSEEHSYRYTMMAHVEDVHLESMPRNPSLTVRIDPKKYWI